LADQFTFEWNCRAFNLPGAAQDLLGVAACRLPGDLQMLKSGTATNNRANGALPAGNLTRLPPHLPLRTFNHHISDFTLARHPSSSVQFETNLT
jgi:hypothetical protein